MGKTNKKIDLPQLSAGVTVIDTHCHLDMICSGDDIGITITRAAAHGVAPIITVGIDLESSKKAIHYAAQYDSVYATVGIHPHNVQELNDSSYAELEKLCRMPKVVAYGEIGLDYVKQYAPKDVQLEHYARQVDLAKKMALPIVIHDREAHADILHILNKKAPFAAGGVMHCFSGDWHLAQKVLELGFIISIPGVVTFAKATVMQEVALKVPLDKLIIETDAPFLAPEPRRGKKNIPEYVLYTAQKIADLRGLSLEEVARATTENAKNIFNIILHSRH
jgi:TatD DNase family protein